ncbi:MAG TPA: NAD-dependent epimerase/dehydratase family protein [Gaiellaceae bacterium]|nr:NAD-dependent epimerase/dehydratase family protein [Gaiellaceae bacterium]
MSRYVVTGAAGFIGSHLVDALLARGDDVVAVDSFTDYYDPARKEDNAQAFEVRRLDLADETLELDGVRGVFHLAAQAGVRPSFEHFDVYLRRNVLATQRLLESAVAAGTRIVFASSSSVYGDAERYPTSEDADLRPISPYGITKLAAEQLVAAYPVDAVVLRYFTVYGPRQRPDMGFSLLIDALLDDREFELFGDPSRSFTFVGDVVEATMAAMERAPAGAVYNVGGGEEATLREAIAALERVSGRTARIRQGDRARGDARRTAADVTRIRNELGWSPQTRLEDGLRAQWSWAADRVAAR